jgi:hypothetical protein
MKDFQVAHIVSGKFNFDHDVFHILSNQHPFQRYFPEFESLGMVDYFVLLNCFAEAGADIRTRIEKGKVEVKIFIHPKDKFQFYERFGKLISEKYASLKARLRVSQ